MADTTKNNTVTFAAAVRPKTIEEIRREIDMRLTPQERAALERIDRRDEEYSKKHLNTFINSLINAA